MSLEGVTASGSKIRREAWWLFCEVKTHLPYAADFDPMAVWWLLPFVVVAFLIADFSSIQLIQAQTGEQNELVKARHNLLVLAQQNILVLAHRNELVIARVQNGET